MNTNVLRKSLAVAVILLFIGVAIAPTINFQVVKASQDDDLVEVTTQACGINGFGNTTVELTREQYQNLEQYLVEFRARLNQTATREEAVLLFKEAVVELNKYGLLPKGMSVERVQKLVTGKKLNPIYKFVEKHLDVGSENPPIISAHGNAFCLLLVKMENIYVVVQIPLLISLLGFLLLYALGKGDLILHFAESYSFLPITVSISAIVYAVSFLRSVQSLGILGKVNYENSWSDLVLGGFIGLKILNISNSTGFLFGWAGFLNIQ